MSDRPDDIEPTLLALEQRVSLAVGRIQELVAENGRLKAMGSPAVGGPSGVAVSDGHDFLALQNRIAELDRERLNLLADRRVMTQRVEDILARLEFLESESIAS